MLKCISPDKNETIESDVVIIGSGAGGATTAVMLAEAGLDVVVLEEGKQYGSSLFSGSIVNAMTNLYRDGGVTPILGRPTIGFAEGCCVGGSTVLNGALMWRAPEQLLAEWQREHNLPEISTDFLARHYTKIESELSVATQPSRSANKATWTLMQGCESLGWRWEMAPRAQVDCQNSNRCPSGCATGAKQSMLVSYLPRATRAGARIMAGTKAEKIVFKGHKATGVMARITLEDGARVAKFIKAKSIFICGGPMQTPHLLHRSGMYKQIGRSLQIHINMKAVALFEDDINPGFGTIMTAQVKEFADRNLFIGTSSFDPVFLALTLGHHGVNTVQSVSEKWRKSGIFVAQIRSDSFGRVVTVPGIGKPLLKYDLTKRDMANIRFAMMRLGESLFASGAKKIYLPIMNSGAMSHMKEAESAISSQIDGRKLDLQSVHALASCPLGGPLDAWGAVRCVDNVYVNDASMLPQATGINPQLTIMAIARRNAEAFLESWRPTI